MDKSGFVFVALLCALAAIVLSVVLFHRQPGDLPGKERLLPPVRQNEPQ